MPKRTSNDSKRLGDSPHTRPVTTVDALRRLPSGLDAIGRKEWQRIRKAFASSGRLTALDEGVLLLYCAAYSRWVKASSELQEVGEVIHVEIKDTHGNVTHKKPMRNPLVNVVESAARQVHKFGEALGLSPASRIKQGVEFKADVSGVAAKGGLFALLNKGKKNNEPAS